MDSPDEPQAEQEDGGPGCPDYDPYLFPVADHDDDDVTDLLYEWSRDK